VPAQQPWKWDRIPAPERDPVPRPIPVQTAAAHQIMWMAALSHMPVPQDTREAPQFMPSAPFYASGREPRARESRWSADAWLFLRRGGDRRFAGGASSATYGASQAGAVVRYSLGRRSPHRPAAYLRATTALSGATEREAAVGISARPLPGVPVRAAAELRASDQAGKTRARPAAMAVTEVQPFDLPAETRGEFYAQAGYVGGRFKTAFVDGQLRIDRKAVTLGTATVRAGGGAWGGAQKGASRLDVGPTATVSVAVGDTAAARVGVDWRFRVAGDARPKSGPALTISAGF
jgi:hypothetical protein